MTELTPREIVSELNRFIVGQEDAKRAVAVALRNRWRRMRLSGELRDEVLPKNILMIGPTGVGKTEIARRLAKLAGAPFIKVEATKFTEVGYVGRDVEQIIRDLMEIALHLVKQKHKAERMVKAEIHAEERLLDALVGDKASSETRAKFRKMLHEGSLEDRDVDIELAETSALSMPSVEIPGMPGAQLGMMNLGDLLGKSMGPRLKTRKVLVPEALKILQSEEADKLLDQEKIVAEALEQVQQNGIVFLDEIDKICARSNDNQGRDVSREGVQRDLLPLIEGTSVATKYGTIQTDHILFITSGAFHLSKPSDLLPELQGRLPIRVALQPLKKEDFLRILTEPESNLIRQSKAMLETENVALDFTPQAIDRLAGLAAEINQNVENIGARRLHTLMEKLLEDLSFKASDMSGHTVTFTEKEVDAVLSPLANHVDLSKFIL